MHMFPAVTHTNHLQVESRVAPQISGNDPRGFPNWPTLIPRLNARKKSHHQELTQLDTPALNQTSVQVFFSEEETCVRSLIRVTNSIFVLLLEAYYNLWCSDSCTHPAHVARRPCRDVFQYLIFIYAKTFGKVETECDGMRFVPGCRWVCFSTHFRGSPILKKVRHNKTHRNHPRIVPCPVHMANVVCVSCPRVRCHLRMHADF